MSNTAKVFESKKAFIPFITAGDPNLAVTEELIYALERGGADLIEIGIPFSDPIAEGIVIQKADERALNSGTTTDKIFDMLAKARKNTNVPIAIMTYLNPVYVYGVEPFLQRCVSCGVSALIVPDMPFEEKRELSSYCKAYQIDLISFIAPTSKERIVQIASEAEGFLYCISSLGVTGVREEFSSNLKEMIALVKTVKNIPCAIGFGIFTPKQAKEMSAFADGVIVGSAIMKIIEQYGEHCVEPVYQYVKQMKDAIR
jgi:tryptophan synthase alpha chain